jgi:hypothetical protein
MKQLCALFAVVGWMVSGCGPADGSEATEADVGAVEQHLTPCLSECYGGCSGTAADVLQCRSDCRQYVCAGQ